MSVKRLNAVVYCCACRAALEWIFGAPEGEMPVVDRSNGRAHGRQSPACAGSHAHMAVSEIDPARYYAVSKAY